MKEKRRRAAAVQTLTAYSRAALLIPWNGILLKEHRRDDDLPPEQTGNIPEMKTLSSKLLDLLWHDAKLQIESFADAVLHGRPQHGADIDDGVAGMRAMVAIARSAESGQKVKLSEVKGGV